MIIDPYTWQRMTIKRIKLVAADTVSVTLKRPVDYHFRPGQYAVVRVADSANAWLRQYSFASAPSNDNIELLIQREPNGAASTWFFDAARAGDNLELSEPFGNFVRDDREPATYIAGKVGITPFLSMLRSNSSGCRLLYCVSSRNQLCYQEICESCETTFHISDEGSRLTLEDLEPVVARKEKVYVCGSKSFVDDICNHLTKLGLSTELVKKELFTLE